MPDTRMPATRTPETCPELADWCAWVDGTSGADRQQDLRAHLAACDRCFATVSRVRRGLLAVDRGAAARDAGRRSVRRGVLAVAATLAVMWAGLWQAAQLPSVPFADAGGSRDLGFAKVPPAPLHSPVRLLVVAAGFQDDVPAPLAWAPELFAAGAGLATACGPLVDELSVTGRVLEQAYRSRLPMAAYPATGGRLSERFVDEILRVVDRDVDLGRFDGDADGVVDLVVLVVSGAARHQAGLGVGYRSQDRSADGVTIVVDADRGAVLMAGPPVAESICGLLRAARGR